MPPSTNPLFQPVDLTPKFDISLSNPSQNTLTSSETENKNNIADKKDVNSGTKKELTEAEFKKEYIREAQKIALYKDPPAFPFMYSKGEGSDRVAVIPSPNLRIFIMGVEVSAWVTAASFSSDASPGVKETGNSFTLQCPNDLFTLTHDNVFLNQWNLNDDFRASEQVKQALYIQKKNKNVYEEKTLVGTWSLTVNTCIFHSSDTVRIFSHIPWTEDDAWLPVFTGYIADVGIQSDILTGRDTINFNLETIGGKLNRARFLNNPYSIQTLEIADKTKRNPSTTIISENLSAQGQTNKELLNLTDNFAIYKDVINPTLYSSLITNTTLERVVAFLFYGDIDLTYREENKAINDSLKDLGIPYDKLVGIKGNEGGKPNDDVQAKRFSDLAKVSRQDFLIAYGSDPNSSLRPTLAMIITRLQDLASEKGSLQEQSDLEKKKQSESGRPLYSNGGREFDDETWKPIEKNTSLIWKLKVLKYIINSTLQMKSVERKIKSEPAQLKFRVGDLRDPNSLGAGNVSILKRGVLLDYSGNDSIGTNYTYKDFNSENSELVRLEIPGFGQTSESIKGIEKVEGLKTELTNEETNESKSSARITFKLKNGSVDVSSDSLKIEDSGQGLYYSDKGEITVTLVTPKQDSGSIEFVGKDYEFTSDFKNRYKDFLYKRGWGKLDPRLFALNRQEFPRTGYPDPEIKRLTEAAERAALTKNNNPILSAEQVERGLKEDLTRQYALAKFLEKNVSPTEDKWKNTIKNISLASSTKNKRYKYNDGQWIEDPVGEIARIGLLGEDLGIPLIAYDKTGNKPIEFYSGNFWFDEPDSAFSPNYTAVSDGTIFVFNNSDQIKEFTLDSNIESLDGGRIYIKFNLPKTINSIKGLPKSEVEKLFRAKYIQFNGTTKIDEKNTIKGLYQIQKRDYTASKESFVQAKTGAFEGTGITEIESLTELTPANQPNNTNQINSYFKTIKPPLYNITNNTVVVTDKQGSQSFSFDSISNYITVRQPKYEGDQSVIEYYKNLNFLELYKKITGNDFFDSYKGLYEKLFSKEEDKLKKFGGAGVFGFPTKKNEFSVSFGSSEPQYSLHWNNNASKFINNIATEKRDSKYSDGSDRLYAAINKIIFYSSYQRENQINVYPFYDPETDKKTDLSTGPILSFSYNKGNAASAEINDGELICLVPKEVNSSIPSYFIAWANEAYQYYRDRTGLKLEDLKNLFKTSESDSFQITGLKDVIFNIIKPNIKSDWLSIWKDKSKDSKDAFWAKSSADYDKNAEKNQTELAKLKSNSEILYIYNPNIFEKGFCIQEDTSFGSDKITEGNPYKISEFENEVGLGTPPRYDKIVNKISESDPNETSGKNLTIKTDSKFNLVAPADGELLGDENEGKEDKIIYQFKVSSKLEPVPTVHKFIFDKGGDLFQNISSNFTIDKFDQEHEKNIANILKGSIYGTTTILDFAKQGKDLNVPLDPILIKRLGRIENGLKNNSELNVIYSQNEAYGSSNLDLKILFNKKNWASVGEGPGLVGRLVPFEGVFVGKSSSIYEFNKAKYDKIRNFYSQLKDTTKKFGDAVVILLQNNTPQNSAENDSIPILRGVNSSFKKADPNQNSVSNYFELIIGKNLPSRYEFRVYWNPKEKPVFKDKKNPGPSPGPFYKGEILYNNITVVEILSDLGSLTSFMTNLQAVIDEAENAVKYNDTNSGKAEDLKTFQGKVKELNQWYDSINTVDGRKNGEIVDGLINAYEKNAPAVLPSVPLDSSKGIPVKKGQFLAKDIKAVTWEIYKPASNIPDLFKTAEAELSKDVPSGLLNVSNAYFTTMSPFAWLKKLSDKDVRDYQLKQSRANKQIDWVYEEYFMADWHKKCVVGFSNGIPKSSLQNDAGVPIYNNQINGLDADAVECLNAANERLSPFLTYDEVTIIGNNSGWEGIYSPHGKTVTVALRSPKYGWGINGGLEPLQYQTIDFDSPMTTKAQILSTFMERLDYFWWINGNGDVVIDFPHYELIPSHYGPKWEAFFQLEGLSSTISYSETFRSLKSTYLFTGGMGLANVGSGDRTMLSQNTVVFQLPNVLNRNGIEVETTTLPFITEKARLKLFGLIYLKKQIMNSFTIQMNDLPPILYITPNTPIYHAERDIFALVSRVTYQWSINESQVTYRLQTAITAIRQRLNYEQLTLEKLREKLEASEQGRTVLKDGLQNLPENVSNQLADSNVIRINQDEFIRPEFSNDTRRIEAVSFYKNETNSRTYSNDILITSDKVAGFIRTDLGVRLDTQSKSDTLNPKSGLYVENERLKQIQSNYGYIYGNRDPILDYTNIYSSNQYVKGTKWQVLGNQDESYVATGELVTGNKLNKVVDKIEAVDQKSSIIPLVGTLKDSAKAAAKVLGMSTRNIEYLIKYGPQSVDINTIDDPELKKQLQEQLDSAKTSEEKIVTQIASITALMKEFFDQLNKKYNYDPEKKQEDFNPQIQVCLSKLNSYGGSQTAKNPALSITCRLIDYNFNLEYKFIEKEYFTAQDTNSQRIFLNAVKNNLRVASTDTTYKLGSESSKIQADIKTIDDLIKDLDNSKSTTTTSDPQLTPQASQKITEYPITPDEIKAFQQEKGLTVDGILGPKTMRALAVAGITPKSEEQIKAFQKANKLTVDGIIGPETQAFLYEYEKPQSKTLTNSNAKVILVGDSIAQSLSLSWDIATMKIMLSGVSTREKISTFDVEKLVKSNIKSLENSDLAIISLGSYDRPYNIEETKTSINNIKNLLKAKKYAWIVPYTTKSSYLEGLNYLNPRDRILKIYKNIGIPDSELITFNSVVTEGQYNGINPSQDGINQILNKIKSIIG